jgi:hypothetical protein
MWKRGVTQQPLFHLPFPSCFPEKWADRGDNRTAIIQSSISISFPRPHQSRNCDFNISYRLTPFRIRLSQLESSILVFLLTLLLMFMAWCYVAFVTKWEVGIYQLFSCKYQLYAFTCFELGTDGVVARSHWLMHATSEQENTTLMFYLGVPVTPWP